MSDLISVIVPIYKVEKYLIDCLESIRKQTYKNIEVIMVNDTSKTYERSPHAQTYYSTQWSCC